MRKRDMKIGMAVKHWRTGKDMGTITQIGVIIGGVYPNGDRWIAHPIELQPK